MFLRRFCSSKANPSLHWAHWGGNRVPTILTRLLIRFLQNKLSLEEVVRLPRFYSDERLIYLEEDLEIKEKNKLLHLGYRLQHHSVPIRYGGTHGMVLGEHGAMYGVADPRRKGKCIIKRM
ncbi:gamma-glutamyltransferase [Paenibacillus silviterrae]|uniref:gamma-glutamyltransferase n=1 Tax=Paenibacillus silviterrae TaxID=3242194 RepID=UPI002542933E|nr:gamma-glutamyltransferase [Paenibacillus chinjuensis]